MKTIRDFFPRAKTLKTFRGAEKRLALILALNPEGVTTDVVKLGPGQFLPVAHLEGEGMRFACALASEGVCVSNNAELLEIISR